MELFNVWICLVKEFYEVNECFDLLLFEIHLDQAIIKLGASNL